METRSKRRRLILISSNVSSWPNVPARFESLNDDTLGLILKFVGNKSYRSFGGLNYHCKEIYLTTDGMTKETFLYGYAALSVIIDKITRALKDRDWELYERVGKGVVLYNRRDVMDWALQQRKKYVLKDICNVAAEEGRIDLLEEVWNDEDRKRDIIFSDVDECAAGGGKLNVMKWLDTKGLFIDEEHCANIAAEKGHLHILQWLREERGLELYGGLYYYAIHGGQLHVMKWLKEQRCPWGKSTFKYTAEKGNLDILQWLHNEGCPWNHWYRVDEHCLNPEVVEWCRANGYGDRVHSRD